VEVLLRLESSGAALDLFHKSCYPQNLEELLQKYLGPWYQAASAANAPPPKELYSNIIVELTRESPSAQAQYPKAWAAYQSCASTRLQYRNRKQNLIKTLGLNLGPDERDEILRNIDTIFLEKRRTPFPPSQNWISESAENAARWQAHLGTVRRHDDRRARYPVMTITPEDPRWKRVVHANEDIIVRDQNTGDIVFLVMRNFCGDKDVLEWANSLVETGVSTKKSIRLDDPGHLVLAGWSSGSRIRPCLMWAKNLLASAVQERRRVGFQYGK
jgi:hypothetical protein